MRRFTILSLMGLVLVLALAIAALRNANDYWAGGLLLATPLLLSAALIGASCGEGRSRAPRLGFAVFGGAYFALAFLGLSEGNLAKLPTSWLLMSIHQRVAPPQTFTYIITGTMSGQTGQGTILSGNASPGPITGPITSTITTTPNAQWISANSPGPGVSQGWKAILPGAANYDAFSAVGHCLFALLAGFLGAVIARWFETRRAATITEEAP
jgi:hypothetical protein